MKKMLRKWLGIEQDKKDLAWSTEDRMRAIGDALESAVAGFTVAEEVGHSASMAWLGFWRDHTAPRRVLRAIEKASVSSVSGVAESAAQRVIDEHRRYINSEEFIDSIVERIKRKQLG